MTLIKLSAFVRNAVSALMFCVSVISHAANTLAPIPAGANRRAATVQIRVAPDHSNWTYQLGEPARFHVVVTADNEPLEGVAITYQVGPEMMRAEQKSISLPTGETVIDGGTMQKPGFLRCIVSAEFSGRTYRGLATAGFDPNMIEPTQVDPPDFDGFWNAAKAELAQEPIDAQLTLVPEQCTSAVNIYHVSFRVSGNKSNSTGTPSRIYGMLAEPTAPGRYPAILKVPGAGIRPYFGEKGLAQRGMIVLEIGIHGLPVNLSQNVYDQLYAGALNGYPMFNLDNRNAYYFRRVFQGCIRANDFLVSRPAWNGRDLVVVGGSQGGMLSIVTAALDCRVTGLSVQYPAGCDVTGDLHNRAGGWPRPFAANSHTGEPSPYATPARVGTTAYYDVVNFARRLKVAGQYGWGFNDEVCPPTSMFAAYNVITAPKELTIMPEIGHNHPPELWDATNEWLTKLLGLK